MLITSILTTTLTVSLLRATVAVTTSTNDGILEVRPATTVGDEPEMLYRRAGRQEPTTSSEPLTERRHRPDHAGPAHSSPAGKDSGRHHRASTTATHSTTAEDQPHAQHHQAKPLESSSAPAEQTHGRPAKTTAAAHAHGHGDSSTAAHRPHDYAHPSNKPAHMHTHGQHAAARPTMHHVGNVSHVNDTRIVGNASATDSGIVHNYSWSTDGASLAMGEVAGWLTVIVWVLEVLTLM